MANRQGWLQWEMRAGSPVRVGNTVVTPVSRALAISFPRRGWRGGPRSQEGWAAWSFGGGVVWNRPVAVLVEREGQVERIPIRDTTRLMHLALLVTALLLAAVLASARGRQEKEHE